MSEPYLDNNQCLYGIKYEWWSFQEFYHKVLLKKWNQTFVYLKLPEYKSSNLEKKLKKEVKKLVKKYCIILMTYFTAVLLSLKYAANLTFILH